MKKNEQLSLGQVVSIVNRLVGRQATGIKSLVYDREENNNQVIIVTFTDDTTSELLLPINADFQTIYVLQQSSTNENDNGNFRLTVNTDGLLDVEKRELNNWVSKTQLGGSVYSDIFYASGILGGLRFNDTVANREVQIVRLSPNGTIISIGDEQLVAFMVSSGDPVVVMPITGSNEPVIINDDFTEAETTDDLTFVFTPDFTGRVYDIQVNTGGLDRIRLSARETVLNVPTYESITEAQFLDENRGESIPSGLQTMPITRGLRFREGVEYEIRIQVATASQINGLTIDSNFVPYAVLQVLKTVQNDMIHDGNLASKIASLSGDDRIDIDNIKGNFAEKLINVVEITGSHTAVAADFEGFTHTLFWSKQTNQLDLIIPKEVIPIKNIFFVKQLTSVSSSGRILLQSTSGGKFDFELDHLIQGEEVFQCQYVEDGQFLILGDYMFGDAPMNSFLNEITQVGNIFNLSENVRVNAINVRDEVQTGTHADVNVTFIDTSGLSDTVSATVMVATNLKTGRLLVKLTPQLASQSGFVPNIASVTAVLTDGTNTIELGNVPFDITAGYQELIFNPVVEVEGDYDLIFTFTFINGGEDTYKLTGINYEFHQVGNLYNPVIELIDELIPEPSPPTPRGLLFDSTDQKTRVISTVNLLKGATHESTETIDFAFFDNSFNIIGNVITATETPTTIASGAAAIGIKASDGNGHEVTFNEKTFETIASTTVNGVGYFLAALDGIETIIDPTPRINLNVQSLQVLEDVEGLIQDVSNNTLELIELKTQANASTEITELITRNEDDVTVYTYTGDIFSVEETPIQVISGIEYADSSRDNVNNILFGTIGSGGNETVLSLGAVELVRTLEQDVQASVFVPSVPERQEISTQYVLESNGSGGQNNPVDVIPGYRTASGSIKPRDIAYSYTENIPASGDVTFEIDIVLNGNSDGVRRITLPFGGDVNETLVTDGGLNTNVNFRFFYTSSNTVINVEVVDSSSNVAVELGNYYVRGTWQQTITIPEIPATRDWISIGRLANSQADFAFGFIVQDSNLSLAYNINGMTGLFPTETAIPTGIDIKNDLVLVDGWIQKITFTSGTTEEQRQRFIRIISEALANVSDRWLGFRTATNVHERKLISDAQLFVSDAQGTSVSVLSLQQLVGGKLVQATIIEGANGYELSYTEL